MEFWPNGDTLGVETLFSPKEIEAESSKECLENIDEELKERFLEWWSLGVLVEGTGNEVS